MHFLPLRFGQLKLAMRQFQLSLRKVPEKCTLNHFSDYFLV